MVELVGANVIVIDAETRRSASDCLHCGQPQDAHAGPEASCAFEPIGWDRKAILGLSIGVVWDYRTGRLSCFDVHTLAATVRDWVVRQPLLVSYNGIQFDGPLLLAVLHNEALVAPETADRHELALLGRRVHDLWIDSYDILDQIWQADAARKFERGLNSLDAVSVANGLGAKLMDGATAPRLWCRSGATASPWWPTAARCPMPRRSSGSSGRR